MGPQGEGASAAPVDPHHRRRGAHHGQVLTLPVRALGLRALDSVCQARGPVAAGPAAGGGRLHPVLLPRRVQVVRAGEPRGGLRAHEAQHHGHHPRGGGDAQGRARPRQGRAPPAPGDLQRGPVPFPEGVRRGAGGTPRDRPGRQLGSGHAQVPGPQALQEEVGQERQRGRGHHMHRAQPPPAPQSHHLLGHLRGAQGAGEGPLPAPQPHHLLGHHSEGGQGTGEVGGGRPQGVG
mmetsp:Transcript_7222/g.24601  ORF Transcript_7222/g.24601 Transcript_7222/m.24601 type:complete len:235 (-) Transcript_7222:842-1546(-)